MNKIVVVCQEEHEKGYEDYVGVCLLCEIERLKALILDTQNLKNNLLWCFQEWKEDHMSDGIYIQTVEAIRARGQQ